MPKIIFPAIVLLFCSFYSWAQPVEVQGTVHETYSQTPLSFVHIILNGGQAEFFSDLDGNFQTPAGIPVISLTFKHHLHREVHYQWFPTDSLPLKITMNKFLPFFYESETDSASVALVEEIMQHKASNRMDNLKPFSYFTYNKYTFGAEKNEYANKGLRRKSGKMLFGLRDLKEKQHFFIMESITERRYYDAVRQKETVIGAKASGINVPSIFIQTSQLQAFNVYNDYSIIAGAQYISPLAELTLDRYEFRIIDTAKTEGDTIFIVKFNPHPKKFFQAMKGLLYISKKNYAVMAALVSPAEKSKIEISLAQSYKRYNDIWFPDQAKTNIFINKEKRNSPKFKGYGRTIVYKLNTEASINKNNFDEIILEYKQYANERNEDFWKEERKEAFTESDSNTYAYFDSLDRKKNLEKFLRATERIYYGEIPVGIVNIELNKVVNYNLLEGTRLGFGAHTNELFSEKYSLGAYMGYGTIDNKIKYGTNFSLRLEERFKSSYHFSYAHDVREAGATSLPFETSQYSSEALRKYRLRIMDYVNEWTHSLNFSPLTYLKIRLLASHSHNTPSYNYVYKNQFYGNFIFTDISLGIRYAYGEKTIQLVNQSITQTSRFPIAYFQVMKGFNGLLNGEYSYSKFDLRVDQTLKTFGVGTTGVQLAAGITRGDAPYFKLYNGKGSLRQPSIVIHNSFETMKYNEFLADRYAALFFSHDFGKIYLIRKPRVTPSFMFLHNVGFGNIRNPDDHQGLVFKTMKKGYYESGLFLDNIIVIPLGGLKAGLGTGFFLRYGPYALPEFKNNLVFKLSTNFFI
ncbi:MAG: DUF5686 family protein [Cytophagaceae bacterium]